MSDGGQLAAVESNGNVKAFVSILPQAYFVDRVGGDCVDVEALVGPGQSPATFEPTPRQMAMLAEAELFFCIGVPFENSLLPKIKGLYKDLRIVDIRTGIQIASDSGGMPDKGHGHAHDYGELDPHIWLDPGLVKIMARTICGELIGLDPEHADDFRQNLDEFIADLDSLDARIARTLAPLEKRRFYVFHPAFGYFARAYGLTQIPVEVDGKEPTARQLAAVITRARVEKVRVIFVQPQFSKKSAEAIADAIGGAVVPMDPLARDYLNNLEEMAETLATRLR